MIKLLSGIAIAMTSTSSAASDGYYNSSPWHVTESAQSCTLFGTFEGKHILWINYKPLERKATVYLTGGNFASIQKDEKFLVKVEFVKRSAFAKRYDALIFEGTRRFTSPGIGRDFASTEFLSFMKSSDILAFWLNDGVLIASLSLKGSSKAVDALENCARETVGVNPDDPFAGAELPSFNKGN
jgi:hypothetical protein